MTAGPRARGHHQRAGKGQKQRGVLHRPHGTANPAPACVDSRNDPNRNWKNVASFPNTSFEKKFSRPPCWSHRPGLSPSPPRRKHRSKSLERKPIRRLLDLAFVVDAATTEHFTSWNEQRENQLKISA